MVPIHCRATFGPPSSGCNHKITVNAKCFMIFTFSPITVNIDSIYIIQFSSIDEKGSNRPKILSDPANILHWTSNGTSWLSCLPVTCSPSTGYFVSHTLPPPPPPPPPVPMQYSHSVCAADQIQSRSPMSGSRSHWDLLM